MIEFENALKNILNNTIPLKTEKVNIENAAGRILMEDVYSKINMPPFNKSAMDGYAVKKKDIKKIPVKLRCIGIIQAGETFGRPMKHGECVKIMTGAALPEDTDSVVVVEDTTQAGEFVEIMKGVKKGRNVCFCGEDIRVGKKVAEKGELISTSDIALLAAVGKRLIRVVKKPKVAVLNTGGELVPAGYRLGKNKIYNSNGPQLISLLKADGISSYFLGIAKDHPDDLKKALKKGLEYDVLLISGGVSMGDYDLVPDILKSLGIKEIFHKVKVKPGKPLFFGTKKNKIVFGIPGNPVSNFLAYHIFITPALNKMAGKKSCLPEFKEGIVEESVYHKGGRKHFVLVNVVKKRNNNYLVPVKSNGSADIVALSKAEGFMVVDKGVATRAKMKFVTWK